MSRETPPLAPALQAAIQRAFHLALQRRHEYLTLEHLLLAMQEDPLVQGALEACGGRAAILSAALETWIAAQVPVLPEDAEQDRPLPTLGFHRVLERALAHAVSSERETVDGGDVLASLLQEEDCQAAYLLQKEGVRRLALLRHLSHGAPKAAPGPGTEQGEDEAPADPLQAYAVDLIAKAAAGQIDPLVGREAELTRMVHVLCRRRKNNPLLVGEAGVGKTALAEGLAWRIHRGEVPEALKDAPFFALDLGALLAGTRYRGDFEARVKGVLEALRQRPGALLLIDEIHTLLGAGSVSGGSLDLSNLLKPALQRGELRCIGATTFQDLKGSFDRDRALARRFQRIDLEEPSEAEAIQILKGLQDAYERHHRVRFSDDAVEAAVRLSARHLRDLQLPDKALDVLDEAGAARRLARRAPKGPIGVPEIQAVVSRMAKVPLEAVGDGERQRLARLEAELKARVFGQDPAVERVASAIKLSRSGLRGPERPAGAFLFAGPTGVGKTELARQLAHALALPLLRFDMSEYMEKHAVARLIGAPPGYVGFEEGGLLVDAVRKSPHAVLLLDEIEKAHPDLYALLLQVMDHATLTDSHGRKADFRHVVLIMTTNAGARDLSQRRMGFADPGAARSATGALEKAFTPEFRNRLDALVSFAPLGRPEMLAVVDKQLRELQALLEGQGVKLQVPKTARAWLAEHGFDPAYGARPLARLLEEQLKRPLADLILFGPLAQGGKATVRVHPGGLEVKA